MRVMLKVRYWALGAIMATAVGLYAQEAQQMLRPLDVTIGNIRALAGYTYSGGSPARDYRSATTVYGTSHLYTAAELLSGLILRTGITTIGVGAFASVDQFPTAANLVAAIPGVIAGHSFQVVLDMTSAGGTMANGLNGYLFINSANTGVTYSQSCAAALTTGNVKTLLINITSATAYRVSCSS